jgi:AhpD family alkylhydroperoxidase
MSQLASVEWDECLVPPRKDPALEREVRKVFGTVPPSVPYHANSPWLVRSLMLGNYRAGGLVHLDLHLADLIFLAVSQDASCRYCYAAQRAALRILGFDEERIRRVEEAVFTAEADRSEKLALDFARRLSRANPVPGAADRVALREAGYSDAAIQEIACMAAYTVFANRTTTLPAIPVDRLEALDTRLLFKLLRPLVARLFRAKIRRGEPECLPDAMREGPFAYVPLALDGLPMARIQAEGMALLWEPTALSQRAKALVFAVVARGLGSELAEREARRLLAPEGLDDEQVDAVLSHLASPDLDRIEAVVVPFARDTIRVRPIEIQRRARALREHLGVEEFVDFAGVVGVANATCRLSLFLCES